MLLSASASPQLSFLTYMESALSGQFQLLICVSYFFKPGKISLKMLLSIDSAISYISWNLNKLWDKLHDSRINSDVIICVVCALRVFHVNRVFPWNIRNLGVMVKRHMDSLLYCITTDAFPILWRAEMKEAAFTPLLNSGSDISGKTELALVIVKNVSSLLV